MTNEMYKGRMCKSGCLYRMPLTVMQTAVTASNTKERTVEFKMRFMRICLVKVVYGHCLTDQTQYSMNFFTRQLPKPTFSRKNVAYSESCLTTAALSFIILVDGFLYTVS